MCRCRPLPDRRADCAATCWACIASIIAAAVLLVILAGCATPVKEKWPLDRFVDPVTDLPPTNIVVDQ